MRLIKLDLTQDNIIEVQEDCEILAIFVGRSTQSVKSKLKVIHTRPGLKSSTTIKAVLYDSAQFEFYGNLVIERGAKFTDSYLKIDVLMLSESAKAIAVPSLEIHENDVKGGHGATVGEIDAEAAFYLTSRGLSATEAQDVIVAGFTQEILAKLNDAL
jgi:Fe-S cluster assembly protein SufD